jgi:uncharacterized protein YjbJ (UPF0337 family)
MMNKDQVKGKIDEAVGTVKRRAGEWTGDTPLEIKGAAQQVKGGLENALGGAKEALHEAKKDADTRVKHAEESAETKAKHTAHK